MISPADAVSKVTFSPVSDGKTDALIVTIKTVKLEEVEKLKIMETPKKSGLLEPKRKSRSSRTTASKSANKATDTKDSEQMSVASQTSTDSPSVLIEHRSPSESSPCLKHAAENISRKASHIHDEKVSLCNNCSKSMLSYIFIVQDFLDSLAKEICGNADPQNCVQCLRQETRQSLSSPIKEESVANVENKDSVRSRRKASRGGNSTENSTRADSASTKVSTHTKVTSRDVRRYEESAEVLIQRTLSHYGEDTKQQGHSPHDASQLPSHQEGGEHFQSQGDRQIHKRDNHNPVLRHHDRESGQNEGHQEYRDGNKREYQGHPKASEDSQSHPDGKACHVDSADQNRPPSSHPERKSSQKDSIQSHDAIDKHIFMKPMQRRQPDFTENTFQQPRHQNGESSNQRDFPSLEGLSSPLSEGVDGIVSTLSNAEREVYDSARNGAGWDTMTESQERLVSSSSNEIPSEAYVTMCRNNAEAMGCLVVGTSLLLSRTTRTLCVLVSDGVSNAFRGPLSAVFHIVQTVRSMDSLGTTKLALLEQPELGISFDKLNIWRLVQFNKCVFLNPDTLVIQNCDELFGFDELSAVPDIGWPDCFNSGVFVFVPSIKTFWQLLDFAEKQGAYDGGDQGLLNSYYNNWSEDITKKLSFIYNLMANVSYTYTPAFKQFGRNVKIVQFHGSFKPWHVKFFTRTGQISPASTVHPTYVQFVHIWINIFRISALRQLSGEIQAYAFSQEVICAVELLRFFPLPTESEAEFYLTPPSVRLRLAEKKLQRTAKIAEDVQRRKSAEFSHVAPNEALEETPSQSPQDTKTEGSEKEVASDLALETGVATAAGETVKDESGAEGGPKESTPKKSLLPGAEIGNYQGMKAWEQGRMDYQGTDSSDNIINRLEFLMANPK